MGHAGRQQRTLRPAAEPGAITRSDVRRRATGTQVLAQPPDGCRTAYGWDRMTLTARDSLLAGRASLLAGRASLNAAREGLTIVIGGTAIEVTSENATFLDELHRRYAGFAAPQTSAAIRLDIDLAESPDIPDTADDDV